MSLGTELGKVLRKHIDNDPYMPEELKPLMKEATLPIIEHIAIVLGDMELACRRTNMHPEIWEKVPKKKE